MFDSAFNRLCAAAFAGWLSGCAAPAATVKSPPEVEAPPSAADAAPRSALGAFLAAQQAGDFEAAYDLLDAALRARYTPARLKLDYQRDRGLAGEVLARVRAALASGAAFQLTDGRARLVVGAGRATRLVKEGGAWKVAALE